MHRNWANCGKMHKFAENIRQINLFTLYNITNRMKKLFTLLTVATMSLIANAYPVTITVDDPSHIDHLEYNNKTYTFESNVLELEANVDGNATLYLVDPWVMDPESSYTNKYIDGDAYDFSFGSDYESSTTLYLYPSSGYEWGKYNVKTLNIEEKRTETCTINVHGDPSNVSLLLSSTYSKPKLVEGENVLKFMEAESEFRIDSEDSYKKLYKVEVNGEVVNEPSHCWVIKVKNGYKIDIYTDFPDEEVTISLTFAGDASLDDVKSCMINEEPVADFSQPFTAKMGEQVYVQYYCIMKEITSFEVNGKEAELDYTFGYYCILTEDMNFKIDMKNKPVWKASVTIDDPKRIKYSVGGGKVVYPDETTFTVEVPANTYFPIGFECRNASCNILTVDLDGNPQSVSYGASYVYLEKDNQNIVITTEDVIREESFAFYINSLKKADDSEKGLYGFYAYSPDYVYYQDLQELKDGYTELPFRASDCPFEFNVGGDAWNEGRYVFSYYNNVAWPLDYNETSIWKFTPEDKDVFKMYIVDEAGVAPEVSSVKFTVVAPEAVVSTFVDIVKEVNVSNDLVIEDQLPGTMFEMTLARGYEVLVNDVRIEPDEEGVCRFTVDGDLNVNVRKDAGIEGVTITEADAEAPVYNLLGVKVSNGSTENLPAGIYVSKGAKIRVK